MRTPEAARLAEAERRLVEAQARAEYHNWNGASANAYASAQAEVKAARAALRQQSATPRTGAPEIGVTDDASASDASDASDDGDYEVNSGIGAFGCGVGALLLFISLAASAYVVYAIR